MRLGVDIGGTFTDVVLIDAASGITYEAKLLTTPGDLSKAVLDGISSVVAAAQLNPETVSLIVHGTTVATNAIIERRGAKTALITTLGFRDVLETGTELRYDLYDIFIEMPSPLVPRRRRVGVSERTRYNGVKILDIDETEIRRVSASLVSDGVEAIAVCYLHSYANPSNEARTKELLTREYPELAISLSSEVLPELGEYGRVSTVVANAYVQPILRRYVDRVEESLQARGYRASLYVMGSNGGCVGASAAKDFPVRLIESGPAAGVTAATRYSQELMIDNVLAFDMGGTTAKLCVIEGGEPTKTTEFEVARVSRFMKGSGLLLKVPAIDLVEIGAGGGSLASVDQLGLVRVGPESAGAEPGPACYGRGGKRATVTDADVVLGYVDPSFFLGGEMRLDTTRARQALKDDLGVPLGWGAMKAAAAVHAVVNENMANAAAVYAAERGLDIRTFTLFAFGGAAPVHACDVAKRLRISTVVVPERAGVLSALGCLLAPLAFDFVLGYLSELSRVDWQKVKMAYRQMEERGREMLAAAGATKGISIEREADMRYVGQRFEVTVPIPNSPHLQTSDAAAITESFHAAYRRQYGREIPDVPVEFVHWRVTVSAPRPSITLERKKLSGDRRPVDPSARRTLVFGDRKFQRSPVFQRNLLRSGGTVEGPALVQGRDSTAVIPPGSEARIDDLGNLIISVDLDRDSE
jgi:N-methylhydantoinase A